MLSSKQLIYYAVTYAHGEKVFKFLKEYENNQFKSREELDALRLHALKNVANHAYLHSAFYRASWDEAGVHPNDITTLTHLTQFPTITKEVLANKSIELSTGISPFWSSKTTGGSTGQAVTLFKNSEALARERAATWRSYAWAGIEVGDKQARLWGVPLRTKQRIKYKLIDLASNRIRFSAFDISPSSLEKYYHEIVKFKPTYLYGYVSMISELSDFVQQKNLTLPESVKSIITTSEVLTPQIRNKIETATNRKVFNEYGCGEVGSIAHECEHGSLHLMEDNLIIEIDATSDGEAGEIIVTDLYNMATPLIRYRLGDFASPSRETCPCGRSLSLISNVHGRAYDCLIDSSGKKYHPEIVMYIFEDIKERFGGIRQFQVIQKAPTALLVRIVKSATYSPEIENIVKTMLHQEISGNLEITFDYIEAIARERSGKLRLVKSELN